MTEAERIAAGLSDVWRKLEVGGGQWLPVTVTIGETLVYVEQGANMMVLDRHMAAKVGLFLATIEQGDRAGLAASGE